MQNYKITTILYLFDFEDWAIHNVGKLWLNDLPEVKVTFKKVSDFNIADFNVYDFVWFGYLELYLQNYVRHRFNRYQTQKSIVAVHDPLELFPQQENWREVGVSLQTWWKLSTWHKWIRLKILRRIEHVITISNEMHSLLKANGVHSHLIPTTSLLPQRDSKDITTTKCRLLSVFEVYPRKNVSLLESIKDYCEHKLKTPFDTKIGKKILPQDEYEALMDKHEVYICTSYMEGGPFPAMDAMQRGAVILTTPVGQIQDIIEDGKNGFICKTQNEFIERATLLANNLELLQQMRIESLNSFHKARNALTIKATTSSVIAKISSDKKRSPLNRRLLPKETIYRHAYRVSGIELILPNHLSKLVRYLQSPNKIKFHS